MADIGPALIGAFAVIMAAALPAWIAASRSKQRQVSIADAVGTPNGNGNLVEMQEKTLGIVTEIVGWQQVHDKHDEDRFKDIAKRLDRLEQ